MRHEECMTEAEFPIHIAIAARQRSGKDEAALYILNKIPGKLLKFADPVYDIMYKIQTLLKIPLEKDRNLLRAIGDWGRNKDENFWVNALFNRMLLFHNYHVVISDARYFNELKECKRNGFIIIKIETDPEICIARGASIEPHSSEVDMDLYEDYDYVITNNGTLKEFHSKINSILSDIVRRRLNEFDRQEKERESRPV